jgi:hypothetical protein
MVESLHAILSAAAEAIGDDDDISQAQLQGLTEERSDLMDGVRASLLSGMGSFSDRESLLSATMAFERSLWQLRGLAREVRSSRIKE